MVIGITILFQLTLPRSLTLFPEWVAPVVELALLVAVFLSNPRRIENSNRLTRILGLVLAAVLSTANAMSAVLLISGILDGKDQFNATELLGTGSAIWLTNVVVFSLWYWELDRGGPSVRAEGTHEHPDFLFPQMMARVDAPHNWEPNFFDYFYTAFTNATAFSPTDTMPLTRWAKMTMMAQSAISLCLVAIVVARAVNVLG